MKQSFHLCTNELFLGSDSVRKYTFITKNPRDYYAPRANHQLADGFAAPRGKSVHFHKKDCFECLSPHKTAA